MEVKLSGTGKFSVLIYWDYKRGCTNLFCLEILLAKLLTLIIIISNFAQIIIMTAHFKTSSFNVFPTDLNHGNTLFGGKILAEMDCEMAKVARSIIHKTEADNVVTARFEVDFIAPAHQGDLVIMEADVYELGRSSMKLKTDVYIWDGDDRKDWEKICTASAVFVALKDGKPYPHGKTL